MCETTPSPEIGPAPAHGDAPRGEGCAERKEALRRQKLTRALDELEQMWSACRRTLDRQVKPALLFYRDPDKGKR
jgi:hypothetical protein